MKVVTCFALIVALAANPTYAGETTEEVVVQPRQVIVRVKGIVCSFCAYGAEKNLAKLNFLDSSQFGDGVLVDIHTNLITLALAPDQPLDLKGIYGAIKKGGYDAVTVYLRLSGRVARQANQYVLSDTDSGRVFVLTGDGLEPRLDQAVVDVQAHLDATQIPSFTEGEPITVVVDTVEITS